MSSVSTRLRLAEGAIARRKAAESFQALLYLVEDMPGVFHDLDGNIFQGEKQIEDYCGTHGNPVVIVDDIPRQEKAAEWNADGSRRSDGGQYARD